MSRKRTRSESLSHSSAKPDDKRPVVSPGQPLPSSNHKKAINSKVTIFLDHAREAELSIRENYGQGHIPPDWRGDGWNDNFADAYEELREELRPFFKTEILKSPPNTAYMSIPVESECKVQAWMFLLNPADMAYGESGYLECREYKSIKDDSLKLLDHILNPALELFLTDTEVLIVKAMTNKPQNSAKIAAAIDREEQTVRKYAPSLYERGLILKAPKNGYYKVT